MSSPNIVSEVESITNVSYEECVWMKVWDERGSIVHYMPTDSTSIAVVKSSYRRLKGDLGKRVR